MRGGAAVPRRPRSSTCATTARSPDGRTKDTDAIAKAVAACAAAGGGTVFFPAGRYLTGSIRLESNLTLNLEAGAVLLYSADPADSPLVPPAGNAPTPGPTPR